MASAGDAAATFDPSILQQEHEQRPLEEKLRQEEPRGEGGPIPATHPEAPPTLDSDPPEAPPTADSDLLKLRPLLTQTW